MLSPMYGQHGGGSEAKSEMSKGAEVEGRSESLKHTEEGGLRLTVLPSKV